MIKASLVFALPKPHTSVFATAWNVPQYGVFSGPYFPVFGPEKTPYMDTFHAVGWFYTIDVFSHNTQRRIYSPVKHTAQKMKFSIKDFCSNFSFLSSFLQIWSCLLTNSLMENFIFCAVYDKVFFQPINYFHNKDHVLKGSKFASDLTVPIKE